MKKILLFSIILLFNLPLLAKITNKQITGTWNYTVDTGSEIWKGVFKFTETEGKLAGQAITNDGYTLPFSKIEIREENILYLEIKTESDLIKITLKVDQNKFSGKGTSYQGEAPVTGEKQS